MTSLQFFDHSNIEPRPPVEWGTGDLQAEKFDPTIIKGPTFLLKNQPITQYYRESNIELSNVRSNDQLMPAALKENLLDKKILQKFPMNHPFTSQISYKALFPNYTAPEDSKKGEKALQSKFIHDKQTPAQVEPTIVMQKNSGKPWRHEVHYPNLPTQQTGVWYNDKEYYHLPKPNYNQQFYPAPTKLLVPNPRLRQSHSIDSRTANVLKNKEKEHMQSSQRIDYYKDGLGTRAVLNTDDLNDKKVRFVDSGDVNEEMRPYFRKGAGITQSTIETGDHNMNNIHDNSSTEYYQQVEYSIPLTKVEQDQIVIENGANYKNYPQINYQNNPLVPTYQQIELNRSKTMPTITRSNSYSSVRNSKEAANKLDAEKRKIISEYHERIQNLEYENRRKEIELIRPENDIRCLRTNTRDLENARGVPSLKQNLKQHINSFYAQEAKFLGERAELYKPNTYNPHNLRQYFEPAKSESKISASFTNMSTNSLPNDTYEHRPKLFADKVFTDFQTNIKEPLENMLKNPNASAEPVIQENGLIQQQTTYGQSYNTKKYLQEHDLVQIGNSHMDLMYAKKDPAEIEHQNITLKSRADQICLNEYKIGATNNPTDMTRANEIVDKLDKESKETEYPRYAGPIPPEPYEPLYCNTKASELGDGYSKRTNLRVYDSPNVKPQARYEPLRSDLETMRRYEQSMLNEIGKNEENMKKLNDKVVQNYKNNISVKNNQNLTARRQFDKITILQQDKLPISTYNSSYTNYTYEGQKPCPPNEYYNNIEYSQNPSAESKLNNADLAHNLVSLQDQWSKTLAHQKFHSAHSTIPADLRENIHTGKKIIYDAPANAARFA